MRLPTVLPVLALIAAACATEPSPQPTLAGTYGASSYQLILYDVLGSPAGVEVSLTLRPDSTMTGRLWFPAPWAPFWGDTGSYELNMAGTWTGDEGQLESVPGTLDFPTGPGRGIRLHPADSSFMSGAFLLLQQDTLYLRVQTYDEPGVVNDIYFDARLVPQP